MKRERLEVSAAFSYLRNFYFAALFHTPKLSDASLKVFFASPTFKLDEFVNAFFEFAFHIAACYARRESDDESEKSFSKHFAF